MVTGGILEHDPEAGTYRLPAEHAACLTGPGSGNLAPLSRLDTHLAKHVDAVARAFREGGGVPYAEYRPEFTDVMDAMGRGGFDELLVGEYVPLVPGWPSGWPPAPGWPTSAVAPGTRSCCWRPPTRPRRSSATTWPTTPSSGPGPRRPPGWPTPGSRPATPPS